MIWKVAYFVFLLLGAEGAHESIQECSGLGVCQSENQYLYYGDSECSDVCGTSGMGSGSGMSYECLPCHDLCVSCFGPDSNQCYSCASYYIVARQEPNDETIVCVNGTIRNSSVEVRNCESKCPTGFITSMSNATMECTCPDGYFSGINSTGHFACLECINECSVCVDATQAGCLRCSNVEHNGMCMQQCPSNLVVVNGQCKIATYDDDVFPVNSVFLYAIIGSIGLVMILCVFGIFCLVIVCLCRNKPGKDKYLLTSEDGTTISESFKKVARNISIKKRPPRPLPSTYNIQQQHQSAVMADSYDPYLQLPPPAVPLRPAQNKKVQLEMTNQTFDIRDGGLNEDDQEEDVYMQMTPATSVENIVHNETRPHKKISLTHSYEPQTNASQVKAVSPHRMSLQYSSIHHEDDEDIYANEDHISDDEDSQENYVAMDLSEHHVQEEYVDPSEFRSNVSQVPVDESDEQELYMDMGSQPPIPNKGVVSPDDKGPTKRKETLDNQYVKIQSHQQIKNYLSNEQLAPKYVNVQRDGDPRLRSVTSPPVSAVGGFSRRGEIDEQPIYQNFNEDEVESYYGNVS